MGSSGQRAGNCRVSDRTGARFCYVSGSALCACRDVRISQSRPNNFNGPLYYSYEACATPRQDSYECKMTTEDTTEETSEMETIPTADLVLVTNVTGQCLAGNCLHVKERQLRIFFIFTRFTLFLLDHEMKTDTSSP